ncbi:hypothetical protein N9273_00435 [bacterium]|nr:hypothetical protein [bacterium]
MVIKSYNHETKLTVGDCAPSYKASWELHQDGNVFTLKIDGQPDEVLYEQERTLYYYVVKRKKKFIKLLESVGFKQWLYTQWQSGDVWSYAPYLTKLERDMITYGNAQWSKLSEAGEDD